jgi:hypothetical protein
VPSGSKNEHPKFSRRTIFIWSSRFPNRSLPLLTRTKISSTAFCSEQFCGRHVALLLFASSTPRSRGFHLLSRYSAKRGMGRLRQATFCRATARAGLRRPLHAPSRLFQSSARRHRRWPNEIQLERLPRQQSAENHAPLGGRGYFNSET